MVTAPLCVILLDYYSTKGPGFIIWASIFMPLSPHHPKISCFIFSNKFIILSHLWEMWVSKVSRVYFEPHCTLMANHAILAFTASNQAYILHWTAAKPSSFQLAACVFFHTLHPSTRTHSSQRPILNNCQPIFNWAKWCTIEMR